MAADWKDVLGALREDPALPAGEEISLPEEDTLKKAKDVLKVFVEKKGRKGKTATIIEGFTASDEEVAQVAALLKKKLGVGGSSRGGEILIQGNLPDQVRKILSEEGFKVK